MASLNDIKNNTMGSIAALQTVLERYPVLVTTDRNTGKTTFSFMLNLLKTFNTSDEDILNWLSGLLTDEKNGAKCLLWTIEEAIKLAILASFEETYTCSINPMLPNDIMYDIYEGTPYDGGLKIKLRDIDAFGLLSNVPTNENGRMFYFDNKDYSPANIYSSMDFNAYLWYVINKGTPWVQSEKWKNMWDNRTLYYLKFKNENCLNGDSTTDQGTSKGKFFAARCENQPVRITSIGPKKEILYCEYEDQKGGMEPTLRVWLNSNRYFGTSAPHGDATVAKNKTVFEFNADYLNGLKLFDSKTLVTQIINAVLGITASLGANGTVERAVIAKSMEKLVTKVIEEDDNETIETNDCYYTFSNEEYDEMLRDAQLKLEGKFQSRNETNDLISINTARIAEGISLIDGDVEDKTEAIANAFKEAAFAVAESPETDEDNRWSFSWDIITDFIKETIVQIALQVLSPKIMLLFEINDSLMNPDRDMSVSGVRDFFKRFPNLMTSIIRKIKDIVVQELYDYLMGLLRPLLTLFVQKLLLETIYYYKILLEQLIATCLSGRSGLLTIDNVVGADIIPTQTLPVPNDGCRNA